MSSQRSNNWDTRPESCQADSSASATCCKSASGFDYLYANRLEIVDGKLSGRVFDPIIDGWRKAELLQQIAKSRTSRLTNDLPSAMAPIDLPMLSIAGMGVAFHANPIVREQAERAISDSRARRFTLSHRHP